MIRGVPDPGPVPVQKIPTLFRRDPKDMRHVLPEVTPGCEWVLAGEGEATRKYDGTCIMLDADGRWWARREVRPGKVRPINFVALGTDENTGKTVGWEPVEQSGFAKWHTEALENMAANGVTALSVGTYELCGPKVNGNPEGFSKHMLVNHRETGRYVFDGYTYEDFRTALKSLATVGWEGIVWHHPDGRMAKLKARDFD